MRRPSNRYRLAIDSSAAAGAERRPVIVAAAECIRGHYAQDASETGPYRRSLRYGSGAKMAPSKPRDASRGGKRSMVQRVLSSAR